MVCYPLNDRTGFRKDGGGMDSTYLQKNGEEAKHISLYLEESFNFEVQDLT